MGGLDQPWLRISCSPKASTSSTSCSLCAPKGQSLLRAQLLLPWQRFSETERGKQAKSLRFPPTQSVPAQARHCWRQRPAPRQEALGLGFFSLLHSASSIFLLLLGWSLRNTGQNPCGMSACWVCPWRSFSPLNNHLWKTVFLLRAGMSSWRRGRGFSSTGLIASGAAIEEAITQQPRSNEGLVPEEGAGNDQPLLLGSGMRGIRSGARQRLRFS